ncbi:MOSC domain-containing protein [Actinomadura sp. CNU-125]|uniref:MOSC domain-containing protein n=1 Tax=Actinomadura sp. CNU-125 TaxID=1904961 RepID=UPI0009F9801F|nr:MOSC N-terminal beta barrel domain-containing protein [Actinomadura sp. CNU-125]
MPGTLLELNTYPLKGGRGTALSSAELGPEGLRHDREFMLVDAGGRFLSQRGDPRMALLRPAFDGEILTVTAPGAAPLVHKPVDDGEVRDVRVHKSDCLGVDQGDEAAAWFGEVLGRECRLVRFTGRRETPLGGGTLKFADAFPLLLISAESLADLNGRLAGPLPMNRFRPSLVVAGLGAYGEDAVRLLRIGGTVIEAVKPCGRCLVTTTDQETGERGGEPLRTLATYRKVDGSLLFGQSCVPRTPGPLTVGDPVEVLEAR